MGVLGNPIVLSLGLLLLGLLTSIGNVYCVTAKAMLIYSPQPSVYMDELLLSDDSTSQTANSSNASLSLAEAVGGVLGGLLLASVFAVWVISWIVRSNFRKKMVLISQRGSDTNSGTSVLLQDPYAKFSLPELSRATNRFSRENEIGKGSASSIYKAVLSDGRAVAIKRYRIHNENDCNIEHQLLSSIHHEHIVALLGYSPEVPVIGRLLVFELMGNGSLSYQLHVVGIGKGLNLDWEKRLKIAMQASRALYFLHFYSEPCIVHGNVTSDNILLDFDWTAKLGGFGTALYSVTGYLSSEYSGTTKSSRTPGYADPDASYNQIQAKASDVYSFGVVLLELMSGRKAKDERHHPVELVRWASPMIRAGRVFDVLDARLEVPMAAELALRKALDIALWCVNPSRKERPTMIDVFTGLDQVLRIFHGEQAIVADQNSNLLESLD